MVKSLRWRLQMWHAWVLLAVLTIFGMIVYNLLWRSRLQQIDAELDRSAAVIMTRLRWLLPWPGNGFTPQGRGRSGENKSADGQPVAGNEGKTDDRGDDARAGGGGRGFSRRERRNDLPPAESNFPAAATGSDAAKEVQPADATAATPVATAATTPSVEPSATPPVESPATESPPRTFPFPSPGTNSTARRGDESRTGGQPSDRDKSRLWLPEEFRQLFEGEDESRLYFVIWDHFGTLLLKSDGAPGVEYPDLHMGSDFLPKREVRSRGDLREVVHVSRFDMDVLIGRSLRHDLAAQRRSGAFIALTGLVVLAGGLVGGWWLGNRAVRPIAAMTATAAAISAQNLNERIDASETDDELGQLATVLNRTFDRLQASFEQQGRFTADASHELRTPLSVILAHTELALARPRASAEYAEALTACQRAALRMKSLLDGLLTLARFDSGLGVLELGRFDLEDVTLDCVELVRPLAPERGISIEAVTQPVELAGDRKRLSQVFTNLLTNAIRYNREAGTIEVSVSRQGNTAVATVTDSGQGISAEHLPHIFERFYRADAARSDGGSGLGLSICKTIVEAHGGSIAVRSQPELGTTFEVRLPCAAATPQPALTADETIASS